MELRWVIEQIQCRQGARAWCPVVYDKLPQSSVHGESTVNTWMFVNAAVCNAAETKRCLAGPRAGVSASHDPMLTESQCEL